jgi:hypothetical protein
VRLAGEDLFARDEDARAAMRVQYMGFVFQSFQLLGSLTALENVMLALELGGRPRARENARSMLERVGLGERLGHYPKVLSGGEQQRVALARAFVVKPALLLADEDSARRVGLTPKARVIGMATAGVAPRVMGIGPVPAVQKLMAQTGMTLDQMDVIELNEAFAAQGLAVLRQLGIADNDPRVNPNGGAIALGHPLGMSGARLVTTAMYQLHRTGGRYALCTMCIGVGQGIAVVIERV